MNRLGELTDKYLALTETDVNLDYAEQGELIGLQHAKIEAFTAKMDRIRHMLAVYYPESAKEQDVLPVSEAAETSPRITSAVAREVALSHKMTLAQAKEIAECLDFEGSPEVCLINVHSAARILKRELTRIEPVVAAAREWRDRRHCVNETILLDAVDAAGEGESIG